MKILIANTFYYPDIKGGAEISVMKLAEGLVKRGHEVSVLCISNENKREQIRGVNVYRIKIRNTASPENLKDVSKIRKATFKFIDLNNKFNKKIYRDIIKEINPDIAHINNIPGLSISLFEVLYEENIKIIHTLRDYYLMCPKVNLLKDNKICKNPHMLCKMYRNYSKRAFLRDTCITSPSEATLKIFKDNGLIKDEDTKIIVNAIDFEDSEIDKIIETKLKRDRDIIKFVYIGSLEEQKGIRWLLDSFMKVKNKNIELHIGGRGKLLNFIEEMIKEDKRIKYHGFLKEDEVNKLLEDMDVSIVPSIWYEPFGRVVIDGFKNGNPVIGSAIGGIKEIITGDTGILVDVDDAASLALGIDKLSHREEIKKYLPNLKNRVEKYSLSKQLDSFEKLYKKYLEEKKNI